MLRSTVFVLALLATSACDIKGGSGWTPDDSLDEPGTCDTFSPYAGCTATMTDGDGETIWGWTKIKYDSMGREVERIDYDNAAMTTPRTVTKTKWSGFNKTEVHTWFGYGDESTITYTYDAKGNMTREQYSYGRYTVFEYNEAKGRRSRSTEFADYGTRTCERTWFDADPSLSYIEDCGEDYIPEEVLLNSRGLEIAKSNMWGHFTWTYRSDCQPLEYIYNDTRWGTEYVDVTTMKSTYDSAGRIVRYTSEGGDAGYLEYDYTYTCGGLH
jgi:hypothetical protein